MSHPFPKPNLWTNILSLRREDAARLGFEKGEAWRDLIRGQAEKMAEAMKIPLEDLRWYAAFHNESHHPHCHIVAYSAGKEPYMSQQGMLKLKASFAREIFKQDRIQLYELQTQFRDDLNLQARDIVAEIIQQINAGRYQNDAIESLMVELNKRLQTTKGKKVYGYLNKAGWRNHSYAAACSVSDKVLWQCLKDYPYIQQVYICFDGDTAGQEAATRIQEKLQKNRIHCKILVPVEKDWNEDLLYRREEKLCQGKQC